MSGIGARWVVQRFESSGIESYAADRHPLSSTSGPSVCEDWRKACEAITLAIGPNSLQFGVEPTGPVVFERDNVVIVAYLKLVI